VEADDRKGEALAPILREEWERLYSPLQSLIQART